MRLYNTLTQSKVELTPDIFPRDGKTVRMYACGPTVYNFFHIGNARAFTVFDALRRYLLWRGYKVVFAQNFTDIDDKMIKRANEEGTTVAAVAERYIAEYKTDAQGLGVAPADIHPRATENVEQIIDIVQTLINKGFAYEKNGDVYYRAAAFPRYGVLSHMPIDELESGARIDVGDVKDDPLDFALWKAAKPGEPFWPSPWGGGRPGWHIECSAMVRRYLVGADGMGIDIHCGGEDLAFPHHENEIAQSEAAASPVSYKDGKYFADGGEISRREAREIIEKNPFASLWLHNGFINVDNKKMAKSAGNFFTVRDAAKAYGYAPLRFFALASHYRSPVNYTEEVIKSAAASLARIAECKNNLEYYIKNASDLGKNPETVGKLAEYKERFIAALDDDFNTADGIAVIFELVREINVKIAASAYSGDEAAAALATLDELIGVLGLLPKAEKSAESDDAAWIEERIAARAEAKKSKNFAAADAIRAELLEKGIVLTDTPQGARWSRTAT